MDGTNGDYQQFRLLTPKFQHINVDTGENSFCVDALSIGSKWSPVNSAADVLCVIVQRLCVCWLAPEYARSYPARLHGRGIKEMAALVDPRPSQAAMARMVVVATV